MSLDGSFFGTGLPYVFMMTYTDAIILPPKVFYYQPKIFGFQVFGKKGSKYQKEIDGTVRDTDEEKDVESLICKFKALYKANV